MFHPIIPVSIGFNPVTIDVVAATVVAGKTVVMGIRPENVTDDASLFPASTIEATINVYELLGADVFLYFDVEGFNMTARVNPHTTSRTGDTVKFGLDMTKVHVFDKETELTITN